MYRGFTLLEMLISVSILAIIASLSVPIWQKYNDRQLLELEQKKLMLFLTKVQYFAESTMMTWILTVNKNPVSQQWCITVQKDVFPYCDCAYPASCDLNVLPNFYYLNPKIDLRTRDYYPKVSVRFKGIRHTVESDCILLRINNTFSLFSLSKFGLISTSKDAKSSACFRKY